MRKIYLFNMKGKPKLSIRQRLIFGRLCPLRRPLRVARLEVGLGGLVSRKAITENLSKLAEKGLVEKRAGGWVALEPKGKIAEAFVRLKDTPNDGRWQGCFASFKVPLPAEMPFANARNAAELYVTYWLVESLKFTDEKKAEAAKANGQPVKPNTAKLHNRVASLLGIAGLTARTAFLGLRDNKLMDGQGNLLPHSFVFQSSDQEKPTKTAKGNDVDGDALDVMVNRLKGKKEIHAIIAQLTARSMLRGEMRKVVRAALMEHRKNEALREAENERPIGGDGSKLVLNWLGAKLGTRQAIEDGDKQRLVDVIHQQERQAVTLEEYDRKLEAEHSQPKLADLLAAKVLPGENFKGYMLTMLYTEQELRTAWDKLKDSPRQLTRSELISLIRLAKPTPGQGQKTIPDESAKSSPLQTINPVPTERIHTPCFPSLMDDPDFAKALDEWVDTDPEPESIWDIAT